MSLLRQNDSGKKFSQHIHTLSKEYLFFKSVSSSSFTLVLIMPSSSKKIFEGRKERADTIPNMSNQGLGPFRIEFINLNTMQNGMHGVLWNLLPEAYLHVNKVWKYHKAHSNEIFSFGT